MTKNLSHISIVAVWVESPCEATDYYQLSLDFEAKIKLDGSNLEELDNFNVDFSVLQW